VTVVETCRCGASIEVRVSKTYTGNDETEEAKEQLRIFRETHAHHNMAPLVKEEQ